MGRLLTYLKPYRRSVAISLFLIFVISALKLVGPYLTKVAIDDHIARGDVSGLAWISAFYVFALVAQFVLSYYQIYLMNVTGQRVMFDMRRQIFGHLQALQPAFFDKNPVGRLLTRVTTDVDALNELFTSGVVAVFGDVFTLAGIMVVLLVINWKLALVSFSVLPALFLVTLVFKLRVRDSYRKVRTRVARINAFLQESITGMRVIQLFLQERRKVSEFDGSNRAHMEANLESVFYYALFYPAVEILSAVAVGLMLWYGGGQIFEGALTLGALVAFIQYAEKFYKPISDLTEKFNILQGAMASSERIFKLLDTPVTIGSEGAPGEAPRVAAGRIDFEGVWFAYHGEDWVLREIDLRIAPGERIAIVGHTGAGKTTLTSLLLRFYDVSRGALRVDGRNVRDWNLVELRCQFAVVLQDVHLFSGTIASNIRLGDRSITDEAVAEAARRVNLEPILRKLARGLDEEVKERGVTLSAGERQLVSFARALAHDPRILILDEATSSVDTDTEMLIRGALERLLIGRTSIVIAHRLSTIQKADRIVVLHKGRIREVGSHQELLAARGIYYRLYQLQYKEQEAGTSGSLIPSRSG